MKCAVFLNNNKSDKKQKKLLNDPGQSIHWKIDGENQKRLITL